MPENADTVQGWDFGHGCTLDELLSSFLYTGFQATAFGRAVNEVNRMVVPHAPPPLVSPSLLHGTDLCIDYLASSCAVRVICVAAVGLASL